MPWFNVKKSTKGVVIGWQYQRRLSASKTPLFLLIELSMIQSFKYLPTSSPMITDIWNHLIQAGGVAATSDTTYHRCSICTCSCELAEAIPTFFWVVSQEHDICHLEICHERPSRFIYVHTLSPMPKPNTSALRCLEFTWT